MPRRAVLLGLFTFGLLLAGCGPTAPSSVTGTWNGTWTDPIAGPATFTVTLTQSGTSVTGSWSIQFPLATLPVTGSLTGTLNGTSLLSTFTPVDPTACERDITAIVDKMSMKGVYVYANCISGSTGEFTLNEQ